MTDDVILSTEQQEILVVDDDPTSLQLLTTILTEHGYRVRPASDGNLALRSMAIKMPDLVLLDIKMPGIDGYEVCRRLKASEITRKVPVIFISALDDSIEKLRGFNAGGVDFITKPYEHNEVLARVGTHLRLRELTERLEHKVREQTEELTRAVQQLRQEIAERKRAEDALKRSERRLADIIEFLPDATLAIDLEGRVTLWNQAAEELTGVKAEDMLGKGSYEYAIPFYGVRRKMLLDVVFEPSEAFERLYVTFKREKGVVIGEGYTRSLRSREAYILGTAAPLYDPEGRIIGAIECIHDITERRRTEDVLHKYAFIVEATPDLMSFIDKNYIYQAVNEAYLRAHLRTREEIIGHSVEELHGAEVFNEIIKPELDRCLSGERVRYAAWFDYSGLGRRFVDVVYNPYRDKEGSLAGMVVSVHDITERKRAEEEQMRLVTAIEQAGEAIFVTDTTWTILYVNPGFERITSYGKGEVIGQHARILRSDKHDRDFYRKIRETLQRGEVWSGRMTNRRKDGILYQAEVTASPIRDKSGAVINYVSIQRDITHEVRLEKELRQAQKMEAIGTLAGGIAHDFNNILTAIIGFSQMAMTKLPVSMPVQHDLQRIINAGFRATDLVRQILTFSRQTEQELKPVQVSPIVKEALKLLRSSLPTTIEIRQHIAIAAEESVVLADATQIHQVLMNLCTNSAHAMSAKGGILNVKLSAIVADAALVFRHTDLREGPYVCLEVSDTGHGMDAATIERIFDPYFTTKGPGEGTGLGLAVVQGIVRSYAGAITVYSEPDLGAVFRVYLPRIEGDTLPETGRAEEMPGGNERVLFVDDEKALVELGSEMLESLGYHVRGKTSSIEALEDFRSKPDAFDLVITDMTMPGLTGRKLAREIISIRPNMPIILCSGYSELIDEKLAEESGIREFVMKPYVLSILAKTIRRVLEM
jgi:PAS domain S-box-containing protein